MSHSIFQSLPFPTCTKFGEQIAIFIHDVGIIQEHSYRLYDVRIGIQEHVT